MFEEEEEAIYLEHGCEYVSLSLSPAKGKRFQNNLSVTERDYLAAELSAQHEEAPKFARKNKIRGNDHNKGRQHSRTTSPAFDMLENSSPCDDEGDGDVNQTASFPIATQTFDFAHYSSRRTDGPSFSAPIHSPNGTSGPDSTLQRRGNRRELHDSGHGVRTVFHRGGTKAASAMTSRRRVSEEQVEELDRPEHWQSSNSSHHRRASHGGHGNGRDSISRTAGSAQHRRQSHPSSHPNHTAKVSVARPFSLAIADKFTQQKKKQKQKGGGDGQSLRLSFQPSWLPTSSGGGRRRGREVLQLDVENIASQEEGEEEYPRVAHGGEDEHFGVQHGPAQSPAVLARGVNSNAACSYDGSFRPPSSSSGTGCTHSPNNLVLPHFPPPASTSSPYASDEETKQQSRDRNGRGKPSHDRDILPKFLRMKRMHAELEVRLQSALQPAKPSKTKGRAGGKQQYRSGDLQDPRTRTKRHLDVVIQLHTPLRGGLDGTSCLEDGVATRMVVREHPPFVVLALKVEGARDTGENRWDEDSHSSISRVEDGATRQMIMVSGAGSNETLRRRTQSSQEDVVSDAGSGRGRDAVIREECDSNGGSDVLGYFRPETFSKMNIPVKEGQRMRIYDSVMLPRRVAHPAEDCSTAGRIVAEECGLPILLCTSLCEAL